MYSSWVPGTRYYYSYVVDKRVVAPVKIAGNSVNAEIVYSSMLAYLPVSYSTSVCRVQYR